MSPSSDDARRAMWICFSVALLIVGQVVASNALRDGFFLTHFDATALPSMVTASAITSAFIVVSSTRIFQRIPPVRIVPLFLTLSAALYAGEWALSFSAPGLSAIVLYLHNMTLGAVIVSGFWSVVNERFDPHSAKQLMGRIGGGASLGGVFGGLGASLGAQYLEVPSMLLCLGVVNLTCAVGINRIGPGHHPEPTRVSTTDSAIRIMRDSPYLRNLALLVALGAFAQAAYDYVLKARAAAYFTSSADLISFFALFYMGIAVATFLMQNLLTRASLQRFGLSLTVASLPGSGVVLGVIALLFPGMPMATFARGGIGAVENSLFRSGYELLYTPVLPAKKRPTKTLIDVGGDKVGTALGGGITFMILLLPTNLTFPTLMWAGVAASIASLFVTRRLHQGYVASLAEQLRVGLIRPEQLETTDATTEVALEEIRAEMDRLAASASAQPDVDATIIRGIGRSAARRELGPAAASGSPATPQPSLAAKPLPRPFVPPPRPADRTNGFDESLASLIELRSGDPRRIRAALRANHPLPDEFVPSVIGLLADSRLGDHAATALARVAPAHTGALLDAVLHSRQPIAVRRRICEILGRLPTQRCASGLVLLLSDRDFELRFRAATSLLNVCRRDAAIEIPSRTIFEVAAREAAECRRRWRSRLALDSTLTEEAAIESAAGRRVVQGVTCIWTLLMIVLDREPLQLAIRALLSGQSHSRGTGLEYLENVLPPDLLLEFRPLLVDDVLAQVDARPRSVILAETLEDSERAAIDMTKLRAHVDALRTRSHDL